MSELQGDVGRDPHARGRAGRHERRGPGPPRPRSASQLGIATGAAPPPPRPPPPPRRRRAPRRPPRARLTAPPRLDAPLGDGAAQGSDHEVVAVDDLVGHAVGQVGGAPAGPAAERGRAERARGPWRTPSPSGPAISTASLGVEACPSTVDDAGRAAARRPRSTSARRAPSSTTTRARRRRRRRRSRACGPAGGGRGAARPCRRPASPATASASTPGRSAAAMTARTPDHAAILAAASFEAMPAAPPRACRRRRPRASSSWSTSTISSMSEASASRRGSAVSRPGGVGEQHEQVGVDAGGRRGRRGGRCRRSGSRRRRWRRSR